jgi:hypothetical protein
VRWALGQAARSLYLHRPKDPMVLWAKQVAARRGAQVAIMALARKLAHVLYALWKHNTIYDHRAGRARWPRRQSCRGRSDDLTPSAHLAGCPEATTAHQIVGRPLTG